MKRFVALTMSLIVSILLSSCARGIPDPFDRANSDRQAEVVTIGFATLNALRPYYMPLIASFHAENPDLHIQFVPIDEVLPPTMQGSLTEDQRLRQQFGAADTFDLAFFDPTIFTDYLLDLSPLMDADPQFNRDDFYRRAFATSVDDAAHYVLPHMLPIPLLAYNQDLWAANDLPAPNPDWTWDDLTAVAEELAVSQGSTITTYGFLSTGSAIDVLVAELEARNSPLFTTPLEQVQLDTPDLAAALERVADLGATGAFYLPSHGRMADAELLDLLPR